LWFGGIGTYVRSALETDEQVRDRANDAIRIAGKDVGARVIGEGANLGCTQLGRIEAARQGVKLNTDAIDNSAGVNTSDVEVNIKIALATPERLGRLDGGERNSLLVEMTDEVAALVLRNNYLQTLALSLAELRGREDLGFARRLMQALEAEGRLDRLVEYLPDEAALAERETRGESLTRPEYAVLLAYAKLFLHDKLLASGAPDDTYFARELLRYFPHRLVERFPEAVASHRLRREIVATQLANAVVNHCGPTAVVRLMDQTGADAGTLARAFAAARDSFGLAELDAAIDALDGRLTGAVQNRLYAIVQGVQLTRLVWFVRHVEWTGADLGATVERFAHGVRAVRDVLDVVLGPEETRSIVLRRDTMTGEGVPADLAGRLAELPFLALATDVVVVAERAGRAIPDVAATHAAVATRFRLTSLMRSAAALTLGDYYDRLAYDHALDTIAAAHRGLTAAVLARGGAGADGVDAFVESRGPAMRRVLDNVEGIVSSGLTLSKLSVAANLLADLARS
jgi:glutamate dehydrogenase